MAVVYRYCRYRVGDKLLCGRLSSLEAMALIGAGCKTYEVASYWRYVTVMCSKYRSKVNVLFLCRCVNNYWKFILLSELKWLINVALSLIAWKLFVGYAQWIKTKRILPTWGATCFPLFFRLRKFFHSLNLLFKNFSNEEWLSTRGRKGSVAWFLGRWENVSQPCQDFL